MENKKTIEERHLDAPGKGELIYDYKYDTLTFKIKDRNYKMSIEAQNFVIDIDEENFVTGIRIFDATKVSGINRFVFKNLIHGEFKASIKDNVINVFFKFVGKMRNKIIPIFSEKENFTQQLTTTISPDHPIADSEVTVPNISIA